jgi:hypothetical protein
MARGSPLYQVQVDIFSVILVGMQSKIKGGMPSIEIDMDRICDRIAQAGCFRSLDGYSIEDVFLTATELLKEDDPDALSDCVDLIVDKNCEETALAILMDVLFMHGKINDHDFKLIDGMCGHMKIVREDMDHLMFTNMKFYNCPKQLI